MVPAYIVVAAIVAVIGGATTGYSDRSLFARLTALISARNDNTDLCQNHILTPNEYNYIDSGLTEVGSRNSIVFVVKASNDVHIALSAAKGEYDSDIYEIVIGGWSNTKSVIRRQKQGFNQAEVSTPGIVSSQQYCAFWISWIDGIISVGYNKIVGENEFIRFDDPSPITINFVAVSTGFGSTGEFIFELGLPIKVDRFCALGEHRIETSTEYRYVDSGWNDLYMMDAIVFFVEAKNDVHVALTSFMNNYEGNIYEIVIGGWSNTQSVIREQKQGDNLVTAHTPGIVSENEFRPFWISWKNGYVRVGRGINPGVNTFMCYYFATYYPIRYAAFSTGWGSPGVFSIQQCMDVVQDLCQNHILTPNEYNYIDSGLTDVGLRNSIVFKVKASNDVHIALSTAKGDYNSDIYEIVIGGWSNTRSVIRRKKQGFHEAEVSTPGIVSSVQYCAFWISWIDGIISVGYNKIVGENKFMSFDDPSPITINFVAVSTGWGSTGEFIFELGLPIKVDRLCALGEHRIETSAVYRYVDSGWNDLDMMDAIVFFVEAKNDVHVALTSFMNNYKGNIYEIVIGGWSNTQSVIREQKQGDNLATAQTPGIVSEDELRPFWISWANGFVRVGRGINPGVNTFMCHYFATAYPIRYAAFSTGWGSPGVFSIQQCMDVVEGKAVESTPRCSPGHVPCNLTTASRTCIPAVRICDGINDCGDDEDELDCDSIRSPPPCRPKHVPCNGTLAVKPCIPRKQICDGVDDCGDEEDELGCDIRETQKK